MDNLRKSFLVKGNSIVGAVGDKYFSSTPIGVIQAFSGNTIPRGFLVADGASYKVADYPHLYAVIGNTYGGDSTNFNVPDYRETVLVGVGENTTDTIANHDVYELGEFKDDQFQDHTHSISNALIPGNTQYIDGATKYATYLRSTENAESGRSGTTTHGKQKGVTYIIKAFHTNEGVDSKNEVSDTIIEYVDNKVDGLISDTTPSTTSTYSSVKIDEKYGTYSFTTSDGTQWLKLTLGKEASFTPITVTDCYGGKIEIIGKSYDGTYKSTKLVRYSYGDWTTYSATDYTTTNQNDANYKIRRLFYYPTDNCYYLEIRQYSSIKVSGATTKPEMVTSLPAETSAMTLIPESNWGRIDDTSTGSTSTWSSSKIAEYVAENAAPSYSGTVIPTSIANGATVTTDWNISGAGSNADYGRLLMLNSNSGTFLIYVKGNLGSTSTLPTPTVISSIANTQSGTWSSSFELSISSSKLRIKNKSGAVASWRFV